MQKRHCPKKTAQKEKLPAYIMPEQSHNPYILTHFHMFSSMQHAYKLKPVKSITADVPEEKN